MAMQVDKNQDLVDVFGLRWGPSEKIVKGEFAGDEANETPLDKQGPALVQKAAQNLVQALLKEQVPLKARIEIWTCNKEVVRGWQTMQIVKNELEKSGYTNISIRADDRLGGRNHGQFNGSTREERSQNKDWVDRKELKKQGRFQEVYFTPPPGGESLADVMKDRLFPFFQDAMKAQDKEHTYVVWTTSYNNLEALLRPFFGYKEPDMLYDGVAHVQFDKKKVSVMKSPFLKKEGEALESVDTSAFSLIHFNKGQSKKEKTT